MRSRLILVPVTGLLLFVSAGSNAPADKPVPSKKKADPNALRQAAMNNSGDLKRGKSIYLSAAAKCSICHKVAGQGGVVGPDLSQIGGKFDRTHLIESILDPSAEITQGYQSSIIHTKAGRIFTGIVKSESAKGVTLLDAEGKQVTIAIGDVESKQSSKTSLMPAGLADGLTPAEFTDLIRYLASLRTGRAATPGEGSSGQLQLPAGFTSEVIATGFGGATALEVAADGRIFICEQKGRAPGDRQGANCYQSRSCSCRSIRRGNAV